MLSFLLLVSTTDGPLGRDRVALLGRRPRPPLAHEPGASRRWLSHDGRAGFVGWRTGAGLRNDHWDAGPHGLTVFVGSPWPADGRWPPEGSWAGALTERTSVEGPRDLAALGGAWTLLRLATDGTGWIAADALGAGAVHVARGDDVVAISDRAGLAAAALGPGERACDLASLVDRGVQDPGSSWSATRTVPAGRWLRLTPEPVLETADPARSEDGRHRPERLADEVTAAITAAAQWPDAPVVELDGGRAAAVVAAAIHATGTADRFRFRAVGGGRDAERAGALAAALGVALDGSEPPSAPSGPAALDARLRDVVARTEAAILPPLAPVRSGASASLVVHAAPPGDDPARRARLAGAEQTLLGGALRLDPLSGPAGRSADPADLDDLLARLDTSGALRAAAAGEPAATASLDAGWEDLPALLEARSVQGSLTEEVHAAAQDVLTHLRGDRDDPDLRRRAWAVATAVTWLQGAEPAHPVRRHLPGPARHDAPPVEDPPTLVTGVTSRSLPELVEQRIPPGERRSDPLLGTDVDGELADLCDRILLAVDATELDRPDDLTDRLASDVTAPHAPAARALLARRAGVLADARLGLLLPFWTAHVHPDPRVVLVDERPAELLVSSPSRLPQRDLLGLWLDVTVGALLGRDDVRVVDPRDVGHVDVPEGIAPPDADQSDDLRLASVVDALVRELDAAEIAPLLVAISTARSVSGSGLRPRTAPDSGDAGSLLDVVGALRRDAGRARTEARQAAGETAAMAARVAELEDELAALRTRPAVRLALRLSGGTSTRR